MIILVQDEKLIKSKNCKKHAKDKKYPQRLKFSGKYNIVNNTNIKYNILEINAFKFDVVRRKYCLNLYKLRKLGSFLSVFNSRRPVHPSILLPAYNRVITTQPNCLKCVTYNCRISLSSHFKVYVNRMYS